MFWALFYFRTQCALSRSLGIPWHCHCHWQLYTHPQLPHRPVFSHLQLRKSFLDGILLHLLMSNTCPAVHSLQVLAVAWVIATVFFLVTYTSPCAKLPPPEQLKFFELGGSDQDFFSGVDDTDARGLKHFPRLWCGSFMGSLKLAWGSMCSSMTDLGCWHLFRHLPCPLVVVLRDVALRERFM